LEGEPQCHRRTQGKYLGESQELTHTRLEKVAVVLVEHKPLSSSSILPMSKPLNSSSSWTKAEGEWEDPISV
jgi:hypothetical protein